MGDHIAQCNHVNIASSVAEFSLDTREDKLVELWQSRPCLYDCSSKSYSNRNSRAIALNEIAAELGTTGEIFGLSQIVCQQ